MGAAVVLIYLTCERILLVMSCLCIVILLDFAIKVVNKIHLVSRRTPRHVCYVTVKYD